MVKNKTLIKNSGHKFKIRNYINQKVQKSSCFAIFDSLFNYANLLWVHNSNVIQLIICITKKTHQNNIISAFKIPFKSFFSEKYLLKFSDKTMIYNIIFISKILNNMLLPIFKNCFQFCYNTHTKNISSQIIWKVFCHCKCYWFMK